MLTLPGLIDPHVHLRDPGQTQKENFTTGTMAAIAGGFTTILDMPNNFTPITTDKLLNEKINTAKNKILCNLGFHFGSLGDNLAEFLKVQNKIHGLKIYLNQTTGNFIVDLKKFQKICEYWPPVKPILLHAEEDILEKALFIAQQFQQKIHVCHISSAKELRIILEAKNRGETVTCGVTPHHLFLAQNGIVGTPGVAGWSEAEAMNPLVCRSLYNVKPSLKPQSDVDFIWQHLADIDIIESDHAPHTMTEKKEGAFGLPGLETTLPLLLTAAHKGKLGIPDIIRLCHTGPAKIFQIKTHPEIQSSSWTVEWNKVQHLTPARWTNHDQPPKKNTFIEIDENESWTISNKNLFTKCKWSPFNNWKIKGKIKTVYLRGTKIFENGKILIKPGFGKIF